MATYTTHKLIKAPSEFSESADVILETRFSARWNTVTFDAQAVNAETKTVLFESVPYTALGKYLTGNAKRLLDFVGADITTGMPSCAFSMGVSLVMQQKWYEFNVLWRVPSWQILKIYNKVHRMTRIKTVNRRLPEIAKEIEYIWKNDAEKIREILKIT